MQDAKAAAANGDEHDERPKRQQKIAPEPYAPSNIFKLKVSPDQQHVVVVTDDDKTLRVFSLEDGKLSELSQRAMPKRPCALDILPDNATILCADKFGDVYSLPLLPKPTESEETNTGAVEVSPPPEKPAFKPSATLLTVHSKRNRRALEAQMAQKNFRAKKEPLKFEHKLLLGHVSMLTDMCFTTQIVDGKHRGYILTADRDEHIRISRGPPQSHVIEGYCLGHQEYVSKICLIPGTDLMVSGGGDNWLCVWEWPAFHLKRKIEIFDYAMEVRAPSIAEKIDVAYQQGGEIASKPAAESVPATKDANEDVNISGMWTVPFVSSEGKEEVALIFGSERLPALFIIPKSRLALKRDAGLGLTILRLDHVPLDVACIGESMVVSLDARERGQQRLQAFRLTQREFEENAWQVEAERDYLLERRLSCLSDYGTNDAKVGEKALDEWLYGVASLRKRRGWDVVDKPTEDIEAPRSRWWHYGV